MQYALLCRPYAIITPTQTTIKTRECRVVRIIETDVENKFELEADQNRRKHHREHHDRAQSALTPGDLVDQKRNPQAEDEFYIQSYRQKQDCASERPPEFRIIEQPLVVPQTNEVVDRFGTCELVGC